MKRADHLAVQARTRDVIVSFDIVGDFLNTYCEDNEIHFPLLNTALCGRKVQHKNMGQVIMNLWNLKSNYSHAHKRNRWAPKYFRWKQHVPSGLLESPGMPVIDTSIALIVSSESIFLFSSGTPRERIKRTIKSKWLCATEFWHIMGSLAGVCCEEDHRSIVLLSPFTVQVAMNTNEQQPQWSRDNQRESIGQEKIEWPSQRMFLSYAISSSILLLRYCHSLSERKEKKKA